MPRLFVGNFDFEHRLAWGAGTLPRSVERVNAELAPVWTAVAEEGDAVWTPAPIDPTIFDRLADRGLPRLRPVFDPGTLCGDGTPVFWGEDEWAREAAGRWGLRWNGCDPTTVRRVNSRRFKCALERRFGVDLPGSAMAQSAVELASAVERLAGGNGWVLKGEFGGAGREVRFGTGALASADLAWAGSRFRRGLVVTVEPRLDRIAEAGLQYRIGYGGSVAFDGVTPLLTRPGGGYLGSRFDEDAPLRSVWSEAIAVGDQVAEAVAAEGYFGPLGIDAMRY
ncbi:MAG TPA: hypothetical protein VF170_05960, partial [Planctomycetaceae bacterium]